MQRLKSVHEIIFSYFDVPLFQFSFKTAYSFLYVSDFDFAAKNSDRAMAQFSQVSRCHSTPEPIIGRNRIPAWNGPIDKNYRHMQLLRNFGQAAFLAIICEQDSVYLATGKICAL